MFNKAFNKCYTNSIRTFIRNTTIKTQFISNIYNIIMKFMFCNLLVNFEVNTYVRTLHTKTNNQVYKYVM